MTGKRTVTAKWHVDETYTKVRGRWRYPDRAVENNGDTVEFRFSGRCNLRVVKRFLCNAP
ncbi:DDE-type integrase/transposase/recombinase [Microvirga sp. BT688]|nr:DDE-type integrase/transposase/recombinase [Microvirga sp.]